MKNNYLLVLFAFMFSFSVCCAQTRAEKRAAKEALVEQKVKETIDNSYIKIVIDRIIPAKAQARTSLDGYSITIKNDTLNCYLPYIGQLHSAGFDPTLISIVMENQKIVLSKGISNKGIYLFAFEVKSQKNLEAFLFNIEIYSDGNANIAVAPAGRDHIVYHGVLNY